jgi:uncharacterized protein (DUF885 family)
VFEIAIKIEERWMIEVRRRSRTLAACVLAGALTLLAACQTPVPPEHPPSAPAAKSADAAFEAVSRRYLDEMLALTPVKATALGDHRHDEELDDVSPTGFSRRAALARALLTQMKSIDATQLSRANQIDIRLLSNELQAEIWRIEQLQEWRWNPVLYTQLASDSIELIMARNFAPLPDRLQSVGARLTELGRMASQARESLDPARVPKLHAETAVKQTSALLGQIELIVPQLESLQPAEQDSLKMAIANARTVLTQHQFWLEKKLLPSAKGEAKLGAPLYDVELRFALQSQFTRADIRARAQAELTRTREEMYEIARTVLSSRPHPPHLSPNPRPEEQQRVITAALELAAAQQPQRAEIVDTARQALDDARSFVHAADLVTVYDDPLEVIQMPQLERGLTLAQCQSPGPLDKAQKTFYAVAPIPQEWNTQKAKSYLREYNTRSIYDLTVREVMPGHYLQLTHAHRYDSPLRAVLASPTFVGGWAVYAERMMVEQGFKGNDPLMRLITLKSYLGTAAGTLLDLGVHVDGMSRADAMRLLVHDAFEDEREAETEWTLAQLTSAQLPAAFVGLQEHLNLREEARRRWGPEFTLKRYHDAVLAHGSPPIRYARELIFELPIE